MGNPLVSDIGKYLKAKGSDAWNIIAAGTGDNSKVTGQTIDRLGYNSGKLLIAYAATLANTKTLALAIESQDSDDGSSWDTAVVVQASTVEVTATSGTTFRGEHVENVDLAGRKRYTRYNITPDLNASGTDVASIGVSFIAGGAVETPAA